MTRVESVDGRNENQVTDNWIRFNGTLEQHNERELDTKSKGERESRDSFSSGFSDSTVHLFSDCSMLFIFSSLVLCKEQQRRRKVLKSRCKVLMGERNIWIFIQWNLEGRHS